MAHPKRVLEKKCQRCQSTILVKYCPPQKDWVKKNNWGYWTEKEENMDKYICSACLKDMYYNDYLGFCKAVLNKKKLRIIATYLSKNSL